MSSAAAATATPAAASAATATTAALLLPLLLLLLPLPSLLPTFLILPCSCGHWDHLDVMAVVALFIVVQHIPSSPMSLAPLLQL
jgi:hypothetical protein